MKRLVAVLLLLALTAPLAACALNTAPKETREVTTPLGPDVTVYGGGVSTTIVASSAMPSSVVTDVMSIRGTIRSRSGANPAYVSDAVKKTGVEIVFGQTDRAITERANARLPARNGDEATYVIYFDEDGAAVVWNHDYAAMCGVKYFAENYLGNATLKIASGTTYVGHLSITEYGEELRMAEEAKKQKEEQERQEREARKWATRFDEISDPEVKAAVQDFYEEFYDPEKIIRWWAGLYDPDIGGFYYANSARDNASFKSGGFLPDMESTYQIVQRLRVLDPGTDLANFLGPEITAKMIEFYRSKQDSSDGYFYHPQWTKAQSRANVMRYTRDQDWAITVLKWLHSAPLYPTALDRAKSSADANEATVQRLASQAGLTTREAADWQPNKDSVTKYVKNLLNTKTCESWSNTLQTQTSTFEASGVLGYVLDVLDETVNPDYGLWVSRYDASKDVYYNLMKIPTSEVPYGIFTCAYKVLIMYNEAGRPVKYATKMVENAIKAIKSRDAGARITYIFNPWATLGNLRQNLVGYGTKDGVTEFDALIRENILEMLDALKASLGKYRWEDGSYSYLQSGSKATIYDTKVSKGEKEGDVNANNLVMSFAMHICHTIGLEHTIPVFSDSHAQLMKELLQNAPPVPKK